MAEQATSTSPPQPEAPEAEFGASYYSNYWGGAGPYERNEHWLGFFADVAEGLIRDFHPTTTFDAGCAMGFLVEALHDRGVDAAGSDVSAYAISKVDDSVAERCAVASLAEPLPGTYDLVTCIEVLEHLPPTETDAAIANLCAAADTLVISSTPGDYGEPTHLNVLPPEAWSAKFAQHGFLRDLEQDLSYISPWAAVYVRREQSLAETVRAYDRGWWRLRSEVNGVRASLLESRERLAELEAAGAERRPELVTELESSKAEIVRLRDVMIGIEAELGAAKGRVAEYEDRSKRLSNAKKRVESKVPIFGKLIGRLWTLLRGRP